MFRNRQILSAYVSASSDPDSYGKITVLQLPPDTQTLGPQQVQTQLVGSPEVSAELGLLSRGGQSTINYGNLLTLPVAGGLLFVEPVYIERANQESSYPQLARVLVFYNDQVGFGPSLSEALDEVFGPGAGAGATPTPGGGGPPPAAGSPAEPARRWPRRRPSCRRHWGRCAPPSSRATSGRSARPCPRWTPR